MPNRQWNFVCKFLCAFYFVLLLYVHSLFYIVLVCLTVLLVCMRCTILTVYCLLLICTRRFHVHIYCECEVQSVIKSKLLFCSLFILPASVWVDCIRKFDVKYATWMGHLCQLQPYCLLLMYIYRFHVHILWKIKYKKYYYYQLLFLFTIHFEFRHVCKSRLQVSC